MDTEPAEPSFWTPVQDARARALWLAKVSAQEIADALGAPSAAAVRARLWRLKVRRGAVRLRFLGPRSRRRRPLPPDPPARLARAPRPWLCRGPGECAFPAAGQGWRTLSCCNPAPGSVYCPAHRRIVFRVRRRR